MWSNWLKMLQISTFWAQFSYFFRGCSACATRLAAQRAEPLFLLAGAVLSRVRRLCRQIENPPKLTKNWSSDASWTDCAQKVVFFRFRAWLSNDFGLLGTLPNLSRRSFWCPEPPSRTLRTLLERAGDVPRRSRDACRTLLDVIGRPESLPGLIWSRFWVSRNRFCTSVCTTLQNSLIQSSDQSFLIEFLVRIS